MKKHTGFTLVELVITIVLLSILAAVALPRFIDSRAEARKAVMEGVEAAIRSSVLVVKAKAKIEGDSGAGTVSVELTNGGTATVDTTDELIPTGTASGIGSAFDVDGDVTATFTTPAGTEVATYAFTGSTTCEVVYTVTTATGIAAITSDYSDC